MSVGLIVLASASLLIGVSIWTIGATSLGEVQARLLALVPALAMVGANVQVGAMADPLEAARGVTGASNLLEVGAYGAIWAVVAFASLGAQGAAREVSGVGKLWVLFVVLCVVSTTWSVLPILTAGKAIEVGALVGWAIVAANHRFRAYIIDQSLNIFVAAAVCVAIAVFFVGGFAIGTRPWLGFMHPATAGSISACAALIIVLRGRPNGTNVFLVVLFLTTMLLTQTRTVLAGFILAIVAATAVRGRGVASRVSLVAMLVVIVIGGLVVVQTSTISLEEYVTRGQRTEGLVTLTGRTSVWASAIDQVSRQPLLGLGFLGTRGILIAEHDWAGTAHNAWLEVLLGLGLLGGASFALAWGALARSAWAMRNRLAIGFVIYFSLTSIVSIAPITPGYASGLLAWVLLVSSSGRGSKSSSYTNQPDRIRASA